MPGRNQAHQKPTASASERNQARIARVELPEMRYSKARSIANAGVACKAKTSRFLRGSIRPHHNILCLQPNPTPISAILPATPNLPNSPALSPLSDTPHHHPRHSSSPSRPRTTTLYVAIYRKNRVCAASLVPTHKHLALHAADTARRTPSRNRPSRHVDTTGPHHRPMAQSGPNARRDSRGSRTATNPLDFTPRAAGPNRQREPRESGSCLPNATTPDSRRPRRRQWRSYAPACPHSLRQ